MVGDESARTLCSRSCTGALRAAPHRAEGARAAATVLASAPRYVRHVPERTLLYALVQAHHPDFIARLEAEDRSLPEYVQAEFDGLLRCGAATLIQCFGSVLNFNVHFHMLWFDGVYEENIKPPQRKPRLRRAHVRAVDAAGRQDRTST